MSVIHIRARTTSDAQVFASNCSSDRSMLLLQGGREPEAFSLELTVGEAWSEKYGPSSNQMHRIGDEGVALARHGSIVVQVSENIKVPHNMYGIVVPTGSLFLDRGVLIAPAKVEPSYTGHLKLRLFNTTPLKHSFRSGDKLGSVIFFATETTKFHPEISKRGILVDTPVPLRGRLGRWARANTNQLITWVVQLISGSMIAALLVHFVLVPYLPRPDSHPKELPQQQERKR